MTASTSAMLVSSRSQSGHLVQALTALEVLIVYAGILLYIWRWQYKHPLCWMALFGTILLTHLLHRDSIAKLGLGLDELRASAESILPIALPALLLPLLIYGFASHRLTLLWPGKQSLLGFVGYGTWSLFQEYLTQSFFNNRLMSVIRNRQVSSFATALMFGSAHIPNPVLMLATFVGGLLFSWSFARHRNIWPLALAHMAGGFLVAAVCPPALTHNMRVGPGYYFYQLK